MIRFFRFSPARLALAYIALSVLVLAIFAIPLWYAWRVNLATFRAYVPGDDLQRLVKIFDRDGPMGLAAAMGSQVNLVGRDVVMIFADPSNGGSPAMCGRGPPRFPTHPGPMDW